LGVEVKVGRSVGRRRRVASVSSELSLAIGPLDFIRSITGWARLQLKDIKASKINAAKKGRGDLVIVTSFPLYYASDTKGHYSTLTKSGKFKKT
jgi:hypothetical protein